MEVARLLVQGAGIATDRLTDMVQEFGVSSQDEAAFIAKNEEAKYYDGKIKTAQFFVSSVIPHVRAIAKGIQSGDRSALDIIF